MNNALELPKIASKTGLPLYAQLYSLLLKRLEAGEWPIGTQVPTLEELMAEYGVGRVTVREAMARLEREGYVSRSRGRGTLVLRGPSEKRWLLLPSTWEELVEHIDQLDTTSVEMFRSEASPPAETGADERHTRYMRFYRLNRTAGGAPYSVTDIYLARDYYDRDPAAFDAGPVLPKLARLMGGGCPAKATQNLSVSTADMAIADHLGLDVGAPVAHVRRHLHDETGRLIYYADVVYSAAHLHIETRLV